MIAKTIKALLLMHVLLVLTVVFYNAGAKIADLRASGLIVLLSVFLVSIPLRGRHPALHYLSIIFALLYFVLNVAVVYLFLFGGAAVSDSGSETAIIVFFSPGLVLAGMYAGLQISESLRRRKIK